MGYRQVYLAYSVRVLKDTPNGRRWNVIARFETGEMAKGYVRMLRADGTDAKIVNADGVSVLV